MKPGRYRVNFSQMVVLGLEACQLDDMSYNAEILTNLIDTYAQVSMLWWVSGATLVAAMLAGVWIRRADFTSNSTPLIAVFSFGALFLASLVLYGVISIALGLAMASDVDEVCKEFSECAPIQTFASVMPWALGVGTSTFALALVGWVAVFWLIKRKAN